MKFNSCVVALLITMILFSCNNRTEDANKKDIEIKSADTIQAPGIDFPPVNRDSIVKLLQGEWKETEYPFRFAHFKNATVRFIEEGVKAEPTYKEYNISPNCPYPADNIKTTSPDDMFLVMVAAGSCEKLNISNDTLILSGFNSSTNSNYNIVYKKQL